MNSNRINPLAETRSGQPPRRRTRIAGNAQARHRLGRTTAWRFDRRRRLTTSAAIVPARPHVGRAIALSGRAAFWLAEVAALWSCWHVGDWVWAAVGS